MQKCFRISSDFNAVSNKNLPKSHLSLLCEQVLNMNSVVIIADSIFIDCPNLNANYGRSAADFVGTTSEISTDSEKFVVLSGEYNEYDETIDMMWFSNALTDCCEVYCSDDGENYYLIDSIEDTYYQYYIDEYFEVRYFKVLANDENGSVIESDPFCVTENETG